MREGHYADAYRLLRDSDLPGAGEWERLCEAQRADPVSNRHWEFLAIALLRRYDQGGELAGELRDYLVRMRPLWHKRHESMNFRMMRVVAEARLAGRLIGISDLEAIGLKPHSNGSLPDGPEGISSQYHAYMMLLLLSWGNREDVALHRLIENGFTWLRGVWQTYGDPSPLGRGRFQLFGYAALAAACALAEKWGLPQSEDYIAHIHDRLDPEQPDGSLSARWAGPFRDALLHSYNTLGDYRAFADFWTANISRKILLDIPSVLVRYHLDFVGSSLIANGNGPLFALTSVPATPAEDIGRKRESLQLLRMLMRHPRYAENLTPEKLTDGNFSINGAHFFTDGQNLFLEAPDVTFWYSPIVWTRKKGGAPVCQGMIETSTWEWTRPGAATWYGHSFRIFGPARVKWVLR
jgi:hypothetical protein